MSSKFAESRVNFLHAIWEAHDFSFENGNFGLEYFHFQLLSTVEFHELRNYLSQGSGVGILFLHSESHDIYLSKSEIFIL